MFQGIQLHNITITENEAEKKLAELNESKAPGHDGISAHVFRQCADILCVPLQTIFSISKSSGDVPLDWRMANISPTHKKGSKSDPLNYRPISLTSTVSKVLEKTVRESIVQHLT